LGLVDGTTQRASAKGVRRHAHFFAFHGIQPMTAEIVGKATCAGTGMEPPNGNGPCEVLYSSKDRITEEVIGEGCSTLESRLADEQDRRRAKRIVKVFLEQAQNLAKYGNGDEFHELQVFRRDKDFFVSTVGLITIDHAQRFEDRVAELQDMDAEALDQEHERIFNQAKLSNHVGLGLIEIARCAAPQGTPPDIRRSLCVDIQVYCNKPSLCRFQMMTRVRKG
jgi:hypothetical protein